jgi:hypothetical protein
VTNWEPLPQGLSPDALPQCMVTFVWGFGFPIQGRVWGKQAGLGMAEP